MPTYRSSGITKAIRRTAPLTTTTSALTTTVIPKRGISKFNVYNHQDHQNHHHHRYASSHSTASMSRKQQQQRCHKRSGSNRLEFYNSVLDILDAKEILADLTCDVEFNDGLYDVDERNWMNEWRILMERRNMGRDDGVRICEVEVERGDDDGGVDSGGNGDNERCELLFEGGGLREWIKSPHTTTACTSPPSIMLDNCVMIDASSDDWDLLSTSGASEYSEMWELLSDDEELSKV